MKKTVHFLFILCSGFITLLHTPCLAQYNTIYDVFTNQSYSYQSKYKEIKDVGLNLNDEIDINYFAFRNAAFNYAKMNAEVEQLALTSWQNDQSKLKLQSEVKVVLANYNKFKNSKNNKHTSTFEGKFGNIELKEIDIELLAVCNDIVTFKQRFEFSVASKSNYNDATLEVNIAHYFTNDIMLQNRSEIKHQFNEQEIEKLQQTVGPFITSFNKELKEQFSEQEIEKLNETLIDDEEETEDNESANFNIKNELPKNKAIDYNEASYYWYAWGLMVEFPDYSTSTTISNGLGFAVFIPFNKCNEIVALFPNYESYRSLFKPAHNFNNFDYFEIINNYNKYRQEPKITNLFTLNNALDKPKKLTVGSYQTFKDNKKNHRGNFIYDFDVRAKNFQRHANNINFTAYYENYNGKLTLQKNNFKPEKNSLIYDERGNLSIRKFNDLESGGDYVFFYNQNSCYYFRLKNLSEKNQEALSYIKLNKGELCLSDVCLIFDENMQVTAVKSNRNTQSDTQLGYDNKNRLVEAHSENDRYNYYYEYDAFDRLIKYSFYEYSRAEKEMEFFYKDQNRLPYLQKKHSFTNEIFEEETYEWEY